MEITISVQGAHRGDSLREIRAWLINEDELRGRVQLVDRAPVAGKLGTGLDVLLVALAPGGVAVALVAGLIAYLRTRTSDVHIRARRADGAEIEISATQVGKVSAMQLPAVAKELTEWCEDGRIDPDTELRLRPAADQPTVAGNQIPAEG